MTFQFWTFINILLGVFALGTMLGVVATLLGVTLSANYHHRRTRKKGDEEWPS